ncbi:galactoside 3(4)-L-fucosyltransferase-like [Acanthaster planci]|uniref:Fucosyltransferase n=1 Tax=Acanthaster planci TaxID=133434 RepID=A0A8B7ZUW5_ACAPL|nr:galactoside 3(4)-L-fucosyltransferase-like [Acanthaster planci]
MAKLRRQLVPVTGIVLLGVDILLRLQMMDLIIIRPPKPLAVAKNTGFSANRKSSRVFPQAAADTKSAGMDDLKPAIGESHSYKIQVYDDKNHFLKKVGTFKRILQQSKGGPKPRGDIQCGNNYTIEITLADETNKFAGMDAVLFHFYMPLVPRQVPPPDMNPEQAWVFCSWEPPLRTAKPIGRYPKLTGLAANAEWTYHRASDITTPFGFYQSGIPMINRTKTADEWLQGKTKLAIWMGSNCRNTGWPRLNFVRKLQSYMPIDIYGRCGNLTCLPLDRMSSKCTVDLVQKYKFYLALENSECEDYITEKVWDKALTRGVVPVVYGARKKDYEELLPPNSFIYIGDYENVKELADYLKILDTRPDLYAKYFEWQISGTANTTEIFYGIFDLTRFCHLVPIIEKVRRGELNRTQVISRNYVQTCRKGSSYGVGNWDPW